MEKKAAELHQRQAAVIGPLQAQTLSVDVAQGGLQVMLHIDLSGRLVAERQGVPGHGDVVGARDRPTGSAAHQPAGVAFEGGDVLRKPGFGVAGARDLGRDKGIPVREEPSPMEDPDRYYNPERLCPEQGKEGTWKSRP